MLSLGLDSLVFVDDSAAERAEVMRALPEVRVVDLGTDPAEFTMRLDRTGWLDAVRWSDEDGLRTQMYRANAERERLCGATTDYESFLRSLDQQARIESFAEADLDRITQLVNKTNQFNLTLRRMTRAQLHAWMLDEARITATARLVDRCGDNGLVSVAAGRLDDDALVIDLWLMSCRVLNRRLERALANHLVARAREAGCRRVIGIYRPGAKNGMVEGHYRALGFQPVAGGDDGQWWEIAVADYVDTDVPIAIHESGDAVPTGGPS
jgi:FkbH-like protein